MSGFDRPTPEGGEAPCFAHLVDEGPAEPSDDFLLQLVTELDDAVVIADPAGLITFWNAAATRLFGFAADEAIGRSLDLIIPERLRDRHWAGYHEVMATGHTSYAGRLLEVPALHRDGHTLSIAFTVTLLCRADDRRPRAVAAVLRDDTDRWQERRGLEIELADLRASTGPSNPSTEQPEVALGSSPL
jgi:PAS domain S-box-containing protein